MNKTRTNVNGVYTPAIRYTFNDGTNTSVIIANNTSHRDIETNPSETPMGTAITTTIPRSTTTAITTTSVKTTTGVVDQMVPGPEKEKVEMKSNDIDMVLGRETTRKMHSPSPSFSSSPSSSRSTTEGDGDWLNSTMNRIFNEREPVNASISSSWREHERLVNATSDEDLPF